MISIKRYSNRKLYNTASKKYITLDELAVLIRNGVEIQVIDTKSGTDLTSVTLTQIILEEEKKHHSGIPNAVLTEIIQARTEGVKTLQEILSTPSNILHLISEQIAGYIPSREDFDTLAERVDELTNKLDDLSNK